MPTYPCLPPYTHTHSYRTDTTVNFYSFRKIKYGDDIRIDPEEERITSKYWRFYHPKFRKGRPDWLVHVKRVMPKKAGTNNNGNSSTGGTAGASSSASSSAAAAMSASTAAAVVENQQLKTEVSSLKERIDAMTKNIDQLTTMVQQVTLKQNDDDQTNNKTKDKVQDDDDDSLDDEERYSRRRRPRKVVILDGPRRDTDMSMPDVGDAFVELEGSDDQGSSMSGVHSLMPAAPPAIPAPTMVTNDARLPSDSELSDEGFVDQLFTAFKGENNEDLFDILENDSNSNGSVNNMQTSIRTTPLLPAFDEDNRPRAELMKRLSDALSLLPQNIQELIVDRLILAITSPREIQDSLQVARALEQVMTVSSSSTSKPVSPAPVSVPRDDDHDVAMGDASVDDEVVSAPTNTPTATPPPSLPLAAATLAALLSQYNQNQQQHAAAAAASSTDKSDGHHDDDHHHDVVAAQEAQRKSKEAAAKSLLIPVHA